MQGRGLELLPPPATTPHPQHVGVLAHPEALEPPYLGAWQGLHHRAVTG